MASLYSDAQITELHEGRTAANRAFANLRERYLVRGYKDARAEEHAQHGFSRRLGTLIRAVDLVFDLLPPELDAIPERDTVVDATIAIQSFMLNTFGCLDNLAWIFVYEKGVTKPDGAALDPQSVNLGSKAVRARFSKGNCSPPVFGPPRRWRGVHGGIGSGSPSRVIRMASMARTARLRPVSTVERRSA